VIRGLIGAALAVSALVALIASQPAFPRGAPGPDIVESYIYSAKGRLVGHIERVEPGIWDVSNGCNSGIELVAGNRMRINEGFHFYAFAKRRSARRWDVYRDGYRRPEYEGSIRRVSRTRWNVFGRRGRRAGHTKGSSLDPVAAGFAYLFWFGQGCFDL
jgi:hypothetical protein